MDNKFEARKHQVEPEALITDCAHLIDLPPQASVFSKKITDNAVRNPKATIKILTVFNPKNGLSNLL